MLNKIKRELRKLRNKERAIVSAMYFKTEKGQYGFGDIFLGISVPDIRSIAKKYINASFEDLVLLLKSKIHEYRYVALEILVLKYELFPKDSKKIYDFYLKNLDFVNNWDLVDTSAPYILGDYLKDKKDRKILEKLSSSKNMWNRRVAIVSTLTFIKEGDFKDILKISEKLIGDTNDLIAKAIGWMLREVYKKDKNVLEKFLSKFATKMQRVSLRYCIEKMPKSKRDFWISM